MATKNDEGCSSNRETMRSYFHGDDIQMLLKRHCAGLLACVNLACVVSSKDQEADKFMYCTVDK